MDNLRLRTIIIKLQDRLTDDDRRRFHFFFGNDVPRRIRDDPTLGGTLGLIESLFDQDKINEQDFTYLIEAFEHIQCSDAAELLREYKNENRLTDTNASLQSLAFVLPERPSIECEEIREDRLIPSKPKPSGQIPSDDVNSVKKSEKILSKLFEMKIHLVWSFLMILLLATSLTAFWIQSERFNSTIKINEMKSNEELKKQNETIRRLIETLLHRNNTIHKLHEEMAASALSKNPQEHWQKGTTCGCETFCRDNGKQYGVCGDGPTCICHDHPITKATSADGCSCDAWCRVRGHENGGICGDGYTCICSPS